tara:strand:+ start:127 stop:900 length:774 start_codon:yes stop_codon:yes gene_type:complete
MKPNERDLMGKVFVKAIAPHRQKVLQGDKEMRLQQLANRMMADQMRQAGQSPTGDMFTQGRDKLMRDMVMNPEAHNIKFLGERVPFEGQTLGSSLSEPDVAGEQAAIDANFGNSPEEQQVFDHLMSLRPEEQEVLQRNRDTSPQTAQDKLMSEIMDEKGNLKPDSQFMDREEDEEDEEEDDRPQSEDDLMDRMARKAVHHISSFRDAWAVMKNDPYDWQGQEYDTHCPRCYKGIYREDEDDLFMINNMGMCTDCAMK